jgi:2-polyprenyl-3-methyl-5-hydroxy-6-metoxy-1,4-benzoquinol methylase
MSQWNKIYQQEGKNFKSELNYWPDLTNLLKENQCHRILDLGCGTGAHALKLAQQGFQVTGFDVSSQAIDLAKSLFKNKNYQAKFVVGSMHQQFPFAADSFDCVLSLRTINHGTKKQIKFTLDQIWRVLRPKGYLFLTTIKILGRKKILGPTKLNGLPVHIIAPYTYRPTTGKEIGITHFMFNQAILKQMLTKFKIKSLWVEKGSKHWEKYYCVLAQKSVERKDFSH